MSFSFSFKRRSLHFFTFLLIFGFLKIGHTQGIDAPSPIGPYLNGVFPELTPSQGAGDISYTTVNAFPNLTFVDPVKMIEMPDGRFMVVGKSGQLWMFNNDPGASVKMLLLDIENQVHIGADGGMLGAVLHPEYGQVGSANRDYLYIVYRYTPDKEYPGRNALWRLSRFALPVGATQIDPNSEYVLMQQYDRHDWHNGGDMFFGPDGFLYVVNGDEGGAHDQYRTTQQIDKWLFGGIFRIDVDKRGGDISHPIRRQPQDQATPPSGWPSSFTQGYYIPNDNPWMDPNGGILEEFYALGLRSPHRMTYDEPTGEIWIGDIGQSSREEISIAAKGDNLQWPYKEGNVNGRRAMPENLIGNDRPPVHAYGRSTGRCVIGGYVYRGSLFPELYGKYLFGDHETQNIWSLERDANQVAFVEFMTQVPVNGSGAKDGISTFALDRAGNIYIGDLFGTDLDGGIIRKLVRTDNIPDPPSKLSELGVFADMSTLTPNPGIIPYDVNAPLWTDGADKKRWIALPNDGEHNSSLEQITFSPEGDWKFPEGTVLIKQFDLPVNEAQPGLTRKLETRFFVYTKTGDAYGVTYRWNEEGTEAFLLADGATEDIRITRADGSSYIQSWTYPSRLQCLECHNSNAGYALGVKTRQLNRNFTYPGSGITANQLDTWNHLGMFGHQIEGASKYPHLVNLNSSGTSTEYKIRSYIDGNCSYCHRPNGVNGVFDARSRTALYSQSMVGTEVISNGSTPGNIVIDPGKAAHSELWIRDASAADNAMPPIGKNVVHDEYIETLSTWINSISHSEPAFVENGLYLLEARHSGKVAGVANASPEEGGKVVQQTAANNNSQKWVVQPLGEGRYRLAAQHSFKSLGYTKMISTRGSDVVQEDWTYSQDQIWYFLPTAEGYYNVVNAYNGLYLDVYQARTSENTRLILWNQTGGQNQEWKLTPASIDQNSSDLLAHWSFDGGRLNDTEGVVPDDASIIGSVETQVAGITGQAVRIGKEGHLTVPHSEDLLLGGDQHPDFSVTFWLKVEESKGPLMDLFTKGEGNSMTPGIWLNHSNGQIHYRAATTTSWNQGGYGGTNLKNSLNEWVHISYVKEGAQLRLYLNGELEGIVDFDGSIVPSEGTPLNIGDFSGLDEGVFVIDELKVFGKALSEEEVKVETPLLAHWKMDNDAWDAIADAHGELQANAVLVDDPERGRVLSLANNGDYVRVASKPQLQVGKDGQDFSVAFWMNLSQGSTGQWRTLMHKGNSNTQRTFAMWLMPNSNQLHVAVSTDASWNQTVNSSIIELDTWTHVTYVKEGGQLKLYLNGILDVERTLTGSSVSNDGNLYFGDTPWYSSNALGMLDDIRLYGKALNTSEILDLSYNGACNLTNVALNKLATQSSTYINASEYTYGPEKAVDGDINGLSNGNSFTHTLNQQNAWWEVDLGEVYKLSSINLWGRSDCCHSRSTDFHVLVSETPFLSKDLATSIAQPGVKDYHYPGTPATKTNIVLSTEGRYVRVQLSGRNFLSLAEVEIMACDPDLEVPSTPQNLMVDNVGQTSLDLNWEASTDNIGVAGYYIYQNGNPIPIAVVSDTSFTVSGLEPGGSYQFTVAAFDASGNVSSLSNSVNTVTLIDVSCTLKNVALNKSTSQSSTYVGRPDLNYGAEKAVDGDTNGHGYENSISHTLNQQNAWWEIDLGEIHDVSQVKIWNRTDGASERLANFYVLISESPFTSQGLTETLDQVGVSEFYHSGRAARETDFAINRRARYMRIQLSGRNYLQLAEVEIMGCVSNDETAPSVPENVLATNLGQTFVDLSWDASTDNDEVAGYYIYQDGNTTPVGSVNDTAFTLSGLAPGSTHQFAVAAFDKAGNVSAQSQAVQVTTKSSCDPVNFSGYAIAPHGDTQDLGAYEVQENGRVLKVYNNGWKSIPYTYTITPNTVITFEFKSDIQGEYHAIGMSSSGDWEPNRSFKLYGTQSVAGDFDTFNSYTGSDYVSFTIPIGEFYTGSIDRIFFLTDHDAAPANATSYFQNVKVYENGECGDPSANCDTPGNIALNRTARQSSTYGNGVAALAVDGRYTGTSPWSADLQHSTNEAQPWWEVDLGVISQIDSVNIFNRSDCCQDRVSDFYILVSDSPMSGALNSLLADGSVSQTFFSGEAGLITRLGNRYRRSLCADSAYRKHLLAYGRSRSGGV